MLFSIWKSQLQPHVPGWVFRRGDPCHSRLSCSSIRSFNRFSIRFMSTFGVLTPLSLTFSEMHGVRISLRQNAPYRSHDRHRRHNSLSLRRPFPTKTLECFRHGRVALACLRKKQCVAHLTLYGRWKSHVIGLRSSAPDQRPCLASLKSHSVICDISHNPSSHHPSSIPPSC